MAGNGRSLSGPAAYSARSAVQLGIQNMVIVGSLSAQYREQFAAQLDELQIPEYYPIDSPETGGFEIEYDGGPDASVVSVLGVPKPIGIRDIPDEFLSARIILLTPILQEIGAELIEWICNSSDATILLDPQLFDAGVDMKLKVISELHVIEKTRSFLDFIKPNEHEASLITGETDMYLAAEMLVESLADCCIITLGKNGSLIYDGSKFMIVPIYPTQPKDTLEAGATYLGGFASGLLEGRSLADCGALGAAVASHRIEKSGLDFSLIRSKVEKRAVQIADNISTR